MHPKAQTNDAQTSTNFLRQIEKHSCTHTLRQTGRQTDSLVVGVVVGAANAACAAAAALPPVLLLLLLLL